MSDRFRLNNFDLIRLFAATQVAVGHGMGHLQIGGGPIGFLLSLVPGVPIFYFVSGFLISRSYESNSLISDYSLNRVLRIYPALIVCTVLAIGSAFAVGYLPGALAGVGLGKLALWFAGQVTVVQFYNPEFMRSFGTGVLNGSLWTITVELQFYFLVPLLYRLVSRFAKTRAQWNVVLLATIFVFLAANTVTRGLSGGAVWLESKLLALSTAAGYGLRPDLATKALGITFIPWFYMFLVGVMVQRNFNIVSRVLSGKALLLIPAYLGAAYVGGHVFGFGGGNSINPLLFLLLAATVFSCAYSVPWLSERLLCKNDISYGMYIYHIPVINLLMYCGLSSDLKYLILALLATAVAAILSWFFVERPAMKLKKHPLVSVLRTGQPEEAPKHGGSRIAQTAASDR